MYADVRWKLRQRRTGLCWASGRSRADTSVHEKSALVPYWSRPDTGLPWGAARPVGGCWRRHTRKQAWHRRVRSYSAECPIITYAIDRWDPTVEIERTTFKAGDTWTASNDRMLGLVCPVSATSASGHLVLGCFLSSTALFRGGFYLSPMAGSCSLVWPFSMI
jgi:hypothetical protein